MSRSGGLRPHARIRTALVARATDFFNESVYLLDPGGEVAPSVPTDAHTMNPVQGLAC